eukprot:TRINITY_DN5515_c0_g1_i1.p1 TRINITY_DN5515_c0_g1~~TRINITY_DN5515_c0_g1_i1.p1  ORF type:complete len:259 (-),score=59.90 TRINITY_DN5515_c0_g1_i1:202-978(-)
MKRAAPSSPSPSPSTSTQPLPWKVGTGASDHWALLEDKELAQVQSASVFMREDCRDRDGSHDYFHSERVTRVALSLAKEEGVEDRVSVALAALLHDVDDPKYALPTDPAEGKVKHFLTETLHLKSEMVNKVMTIIDGVSYSKSLSKTQETISPELAVVQDADRLDAIGAVGIARTFCYGGLKKRALFDPDVAPCAPEDYSTSSTDPTINHFYEKLLRVKEKMKTEAGKKLALSRHNYMETFLQQFYSEWFSTPITADS